MNETNLKIIYSKCDSREVTEAMDFLLNTRDELYFNKIFSGCKFACVNGGNYNQSEIRMKGNKFPDLKKLLATKFFRISMLVSFPICIFSFVDSILSRKSLVGVLFLLIIWYAVYWNWFSTDTIPIYQGPEKNMLLWENREDHKNHLWCVPEFYHFFSMIARYNFFKAGEWGIKETGDRYAEAARDLSWLRCVCLISEDIRNFAQLYGEENVAVEFRGSDGECTIDLTGMRIGASDTVVPVEEQAGKRSFTVPSLIIGKVARIYREQGILDLSVLDERYAAVEASHILDGRRRTEIDYSKLLAGKDQENRI